jgi:hypothetical protein
MGSETGVANNNHVKFYLEDGVIKYEALHGIQYLRGDLFPRIEDDGITVTKLEFEYSPKNSIETVNSNVLVYVIMEAEIEMENSKSPTRTITYKTSVNVGG